MRLPSLPPLLFEPLLRRGLAEDLGRAGDVTSDAIIDEQLRVAALMVARQPGRVAGVAMGCAAFPLLDPAVAVCVQVSDGAAVERDGVLARIEGPARAILAAERTALNLVGHLSGIATLTRQLVEQVAETKGRVVCTRKTTPGLRALEKYAVRAGGGANHRFGLDDAVLIKDNHLAIAGGVAEAVQRARAYVGHTVKIEIEVDTLEQLREAIELGVDAVLLDNMPLETLRQAVTIVAGRAITEASGGITPATAAAVAATGVDLLSVGWLTHSAPSLDVALDVDIDER